MLHMQRKDVARADTKPCMCKAKNWVGRGKEMCAQACRVWNFDTCQKCRSLYNHTRCTWELLHFDLLKVNEFCPISNVLRMQAKTFLLHLRQNGPWKTVQQLEQRRQKGTCRKLQRDQSSHHLSTWVQCVRCTVVFWNDKPFSDPQILYGQFPQKGTKKVKGKNYALFGLQTFMTEFGSLDAMGKVEQAKKLVG